MSTVFTTRVINNIIELGLYVQYVTKIVKMNIRYRGIIVIVLRSYKQASIAQKGKTNETLVLLPLIG